MPVKVRKPLKTQGIEEYQLSAVGSALPSETLADLRESEKALHQALRRLIKAAPAIRRADIAKLQAGIADARGGAA